MATTGMWAVKNRLDHLVNYVSNPYKTIGLETLLSIIRLMVKRLLKKDMSLILTVYLIIQN